MTLVYLFEIYRFILISYRGDKNRKRKIPCTDSNRFMLLWSKHSVSRILLTIRKDVIRRCNFLYSSCALYVQFILTAGKWFWKWIGKFVKMEYVSTEMNCRQMSVIVHPSANKLAWFKRSLNATFRLSLSIIFPQWFVSAKSFPIKDLLVSIAFGWVHVVRMWMINKCLANPPSACTLLFASQNVNPRLPSVFRP